MYRREYPDTCEMRFNGVLYEVNLRAFRRALVHRQIEGLYLKGHSELAAAADTSRSKVSRLFRGRSVSLPTLTAIAEALGLDINDVTTAVGPDPDSLTSPPPDGEPSSRPRDSPVEGCATRP